VPLPVLPQQLAYARVLSSVSPSTKPTARKALALEQVLSWLHIGYSCEKIAALFRIRNKDGNFRVELCPPRAYVVARFLEQNALPALIVAGYCEGFED
jgi:hypothetical protein